VYQEFENVEMSPERRPSTLNRLAARLERVESGLSWLENAPPGQERQGGAPDLLEADPAALARWLDAIASAPTDSPGPLPTEM
jgi:hypothetical protein